MPDTTMPPGNGEPVDAVDADRFDAEPFEDVQAALTGVPHLRPDVAVGDPIPDWVWDRVRLAVANEAAARAAATQDNVVPFPPAGAHPSATGAGASAPHRFRWVGGLVAASAAILVITIAVQVTGGSSSSGNLVAVGAADKAVPASLAAPAPAAAPSNSVALQADVAAPADQPAKMVMESNTQYTQAGLTGQVRTLLDRLGVHTAREARQLQPQPAALPIEGGFTTSWQSIRDCLTWLAKAPGVQAIVIDRATYEGAEAGVIVVPSGVVDATVTPPPTATVESSMGTMDVWVVNPACQQQVDSILEHLPFAWQP